MFTALFRSLRLIFALITAAVWMTANAPYARAADASAWSGDSRSAARLIAGASRSQDGIAIDRAGIEIRLADGWKTYWRYPGDSGVPPQFDFSASDNVRTVSVQWPAPQRFTDSEGSTIGYKSNVVFPLRIERQDNGRPVTLRVKLDYAICERLCIPVEAKAELPLGSAAPASEPQVAAAEAAIPRAQALRMAAPLSIWNIVAELDAKPARVLVEVKAPAGAPLTLFAEGPSPDWALPLPEPVDGGGDPGLKRFAVVLDGLPSGANARGAKLKFTAVSGAHAIETEVRLD